jgi:hypothetical protein
VNRIKGKAEYDKKGERQMKIEMAILVLAVTVPAVAMVNFTATDAGSGKLQIAYTTTDGDAPRGVALRISLSDGAVVDTSSFYSPIAIVDPAFNAFPDYAFSNPLNYAVGAGHPLALATEAGALAADASDFSVSMGVLDQTGAQKAGPTSTANLIIIQLKGGTAEDIIVTITGDTLRGPASGVVGSVLTSNLPITTRIVIGDCGCLKCSAPFYNDWVAWGKPACWCYERQCRGDINGKKDGVAVKYYVSGADLSLFKTAYAKNDAALQLVAGGICSDLNHKADGIAVKYRVSGTDLAIFKQYYAKADAAVPSCDSFNYNIWFKP